MAEASSRADRWKKATLVAAAALVLLVFWAPAASAAPKRTIILVVDTSDSMNEFSGTGQGTRLTDAKAALRSTIGSLNDNDRVGLHEFSGACGDGGELLVQPDTGNRDQLRDKVTALETGGGTPTPDAIRKAASEFPKDSSEKVLILVSDGESSCDEDPCQVVVEVQQQSGIKFVAHTVGFQTSDQANTELSCIADRTGGKYFAADDEAAISDSLAEALLPVVGDDVSTILNALPMPSDVPLDAESVGKTAGLAAGLVLLIGFPAELFNRTFEENQRRMSRWWRRRSGGGSRGVGGPNPAGGGGGAAGPFPPGGGGGTGPGAGGAGSGMTGTHAGDPGMTGQHASGGAGWGGTAPGGGPGMHAGPGGGGAGAYGPGGSAGMGAGPGGAGAAGGTGTYAAGGAYGATGGSGAFGATGGSGTYGAAGGSGTYGAAGGSGAYGAAAMPGGSLWASPWILPVFVVLSAILSTFVDPDSGFNAKSGILLLGFLVAAPLVIFAYAWPNEQVAKRASGVPGVIKTVPAALGLAIFCTALSRISDFVPGYVFGLVLGYVALRERRMSRAQEGKGVLFGAIGALLVSVGAWVGLEFVHEKAIAVDANVGLVIADTILGTTFILGVETVIFGLIPLSVLDGNKLRKWNTWIWAGTYAVAVLLFVHVLVLNSGQAGSDDDASLTAALVLFAGFALVSGLFWAYFKYVPDPAALPRPAAAGMPTGAYRAVPPQMPPYPGPPPPGSMPPPPPAGQTYVPPPAQPPMPPSAPAAAPPPPSMPPSPGYPPPSDTPPPPAGPPPGAH